MEKNPMSDTTNQPTRHIYNASSSSLVALLQAYPADLPCPTHPHGSHSSERKGTGPVGYR